MNRRPFHSFFAENFPCIESLIGWIIILDFPDSNSSISDECFFSNSMGDYFDHRGTSPGLGCCRRGLFPTAFKNQKNMSIDSQAASEVGVIKNGSPV